MNNLSRRSPLSLEPYSTKAPSSLRAPPTFLLWTSRPQATRPPDFRTSYPALPPTTSPSSWSTTQIFRRRDRLVSRCLVPELEVAADRLRRQHRQRDLPLLAIQASLLHFRRHRLRGSASKPPRCGGCEGSPHLVLSLFGSFSESSSARQ